MSEKRKIVIGLVILFGLEIVLYSRSFSMFFCGDSLFFLNRRLTGLSDAIRIFTQVDYLEEYRPLTFVLFSFIYYPLFKLDPFGYHFIPLIFHMVNTYLVFLLMRRLLKTNLGAYAATFCFGIHSINFFVTYDMTMLPDFTYAFFYLLALLSFLNYLDTDKKTWLAGCVLMFILSLTAKEAAITLLATAVLATMIKAERRTSDEPLFKTLFQAIRKASPLVTVAIVYLIALLAIKGWNLYPQRAGHPHHADFALKAFVMKYKYLLWAFNVPDNLRWQRRALPKLIATAGLVPLIGIFIVFLIRSLFVKNRALWGGALWYVATLSPVLLLSNITMTHNLYVPIVGLALAFGSIAETALVYTKRRGAAVGTGLLVTASAVIIFACWINTSSNLADSWVANGSTIAKTSLDDLKRARPTLPAGTTLYFLRSVEKDLPWFFDYGQLFNLFYNNPSITSLFADRRAKLPPDYLDNDKVLILRFLRPHLYDVTEEFKADMQDTTSLKLIQLVSEKNISFNRNEVYPNYDAFDTPTGKPVFTYQLARANIGREALVTIAGTRLRFDIPRIEKDSRLIFGVAMAFDAGDGAEGQVYFEYDGKRNLLYSRLISPAQNESDRRWFDESIDLSEYTGKKGALVFECNSGPRKDAVADWMAWSIMKIQHASNGRVSSASSYVRQPSYIRINPTSVRRGEYAIITVGNGVQMTIDCKYKFNGEENIKEKWLTTNAAGQFMFQPTEAGRWEITAIRNSLSHKWVPTQATLVVE
jgi:hypothetical protein